MKKKMGKIVMLVLILSLLLMNLPTTFAADHVPSPMDAMAASVAVSPSAIPAMSPSASPAALPGAMPNTTPVMALAQPVSALPLTDIAGHWAKETIQRWWARGLITGYQDGRFQPDHFISRAEFMTLVNKAYGYSLTVAIAYPDVMADAWYAKAVSAAKAAGYISGYPGGMMKPDLPISREEAAAILMKINRLMEEANAANRFTDATMMTWSKGAIGAMYKAGIMSGYPDGRFGPRKYITRSEAVVSLDRAMKKDMISPVIQLIGSSPASANLVRAATQVAGANGYADPGAVAFDNIDGNLSGSIVVTGKVNMFAAGSTGNQLTYTVTDSAGNTASVTRTVNVAARLDPATIPKFTTPLLIPWAMPKAVDPNKASPVADYYEIAMRQFTQQMLPAKDQNNAPTNLPKTTVWGYGDASRANAVFNAPSLTIEATSGVPARIKWINDLKDANGNYLPHLLPIDQTLDWANPAGMAGIPNQASYVGPVPIVTHVHGAHVVQESDGYPLAWYLPATASIPAGFKTTGSFYDIYKLTAKSGTSWTAGSAVFDYANDHRASTIWYHDHAMGMTRTNVYAGPAGFYLIRGGAEDVVTVAGGAPATLPGPAPSTYADYAASIAAGSAYEVPIAIQDRAFNTDGSLFYPASRADFDDYAGSYAPDPTSDIAPIWNPEFFGDTIIANGNTWPTMNVQPKKYRFRFLNGAQARTFILGLNDVTTPANNAALAFWQIGSDGGYLAAPTRLNQLLMMPAERADVIIDFSRAAVGDRIILTNAGPDGPYQGGMPGEEGFESADPHTTGQVMQFVVIPADGRIDQTTDPSLLVLPKIGTLTPTAGTPVRKLSLNEDMSSLVRETNSEEESSQAGMDMFGPRRALLGTVTDSGGVLSANPMLFMDAVTENIKLNDTEVWEFYNFTADAHPIHLHLVEFQVVNRQDFDPESGLVSGSARSASSWESGYKDTVMALPGQVTRIRAKFDMVGRYLWHCHILEHEDNEMMRPYLVK